MQYNAAMFGIYIKCLNSSLDKWVNSIQFVDLFIFFTFTFIYI